VHRLREKASDAKAAAFAGFIAGLEAGPNPFGWALEERRPDVGPADGRKSDGRPPDGRAE
jgi:hypothetical protein